MQVGRNVCRTLSLLPERPVAAADRRHSLTRSLLSSVHPRYIRNCDRLMTAPPSNLKQRSAVSRPRGREATTPKAYIFNVADRLKRWNAQNTETRPNTCPYVALRKSLTCAMFLSTRSRSLPRMILLPTPGMTSFCHHPRIYIPAQKKPSSALRSPFLIV